MKKILLPLLSIILGAVLAFTAENVLAKYADQITQSAEPLDTTIEYQNGDLHNQPNLFEKRETFGIESVHGQMSYQGRLYENDTLFNGTIPITFSLYSDISGGDLFWQEKQIVTVNDGLINVMLGSINPIADKIIYFQIQLWLGVWPAGSPTDLSPRQPLSTVGYALNILPGATMNDQNPPGTYGTALYLYSANHPAFYARSDLSNAIKAESFFSGTSAIIGYAHGVGSFAGVFLNSSLNGYGTAISATHGSLITATYGSGIRSLSINGLENDNYGVRALSQGGDGVFGWSQGTDNMDRGVVARSDSGYGIYAYTNGTDQFGAYINDPLFVNGGCVGCYLQYIGVNSSTSILHVGDLLSPNGVTTVLENIADPLLSVVEFSSSKGFLGVVSGRLEPFQVSPKRENVSPGVHFKRSSGLINPGDYLTLIIQGPAQVRITSDISIKIGDTLYIDEVSVNTSAGTPLGRVLSLPDVEGITWILIGLD